MDTPLQYHVPEDFALRSGDDERTKRAKLVIALVVALPVCVVLAVLYEKLEYWIDAAHVKVGCSVAFGIAIGLLSRFVADVCSIRRPLWAIFLGLLIGLVTLYAAWIYWLHAFALRYTLPLTTWRLISRPIFTAQFINKINEVGVWTYQGNTIRGWSLWIIWLGEALFIVGGSAFIAQIGITPMAAQPDNAMCPTCRKRVERDCRLPPLAVDRQDELIESAIALRFDDFRTHEMLGTFGNPEQINVSVYVCPKCKTFKTFHVTRTDTDYTKGVSTSRTVALVNHRPIEDAQADEFRTLCKAMTPADDEAEES